MSGSPQPSNASQSTASNLMTRRRAKPYQLLSEGLGYLLRGNGSYEFVLLRDSPLGPENIDGDDIDLLGTRESVNSLIEYAFQLAKSGFFHIRIVSKIPDKTLFLLYSIDGKHVLAFDLWVNLWQIEHGRCKLRYVDCRPLVENQTTAIRRLPVQLEACVYIHHIATKKKHINAERVQHRLCYYGAACRESGFNEIADIVDAIRKNNEIARETITFTKKLIDSEIGAPLPIRSPTSLTAASLSRLKHWWLGSPRRVTLIAIMGCDGSGKTSLAKSLLANASNINSVYKGKSLYRRSIPYNILLATVRPLLRHNREAFDEQIALVAYLQAAIKLRFFVLWRLLIRCSGLTIIDRTLADFVYVERKTDQPRFCNGFFVAHFVGCRIPVAHLVVSNDVLMERKNEFTKSGQHIYDHDMFRFHSRRIPTDYTVFYNGHSLSNSSAAMIRLIAAAEFGKVTSGRTQVAADLGIASPVTTSGDAGQRVR
jgi:hypothetical protein